MRYQAAIRWIVENDDVSGIVDTKSPMTTTMALVADLFEKSDTQVKRDVINTKRQKEH